MRKATQFKLQQQKSELHTWRIALVQWGFLNVIYISCQNKTNKTKTPSSIQTGDPSEDEHVLDWLLARKSKF